VEKIYTQHSFERKKLFHLRELLIIHMEQKTIKELIQELKQLKLRENKIVEALSHHQCLSARFKIGDRVRIVNQVRRPKRWPQDRDWNSERARNATVTDIDNFNERVYITTDNGIATWRKEHNLTKL
jgi:ligand-binding sensor domain-containing protein